MKHLQIFAVGLIEVLKCIGMALGIITGLLLLSFLIAGPFYFFFYRQFIYASVVSSVDLLIIVYLIGFFTMEERAKKKLQTD